MGNFVRNLLAVVCGVIVFSIVFSAVCILLGFLSGIPFLRSILFYPSDAAWALIVFPPSASAFAAAFISLKIAKTTIPTMIVVALYWIAVIVSMFTRDAFSLQSLLTYVCGLASCFICFQHQEEGA